MNMLILFFLIATYNIPFEEIKGIEAKSIMPKFRIDGSVSKYDTSSVFIFSYKDLKVYKLVYQSDSFRYSKLISSIKRHHYFVKKDDESFGYNYDFNKSQSGVKVSSDSMFKNQWIVQNNIYPIFSQNIINVTSSVWSVDRDTLEEKYSIKNIANPKISGSADLVFVKSLKDESFTLSRELDSIKGMKLQKIKLRTNAVPVNDSLTIQKFETITEFKRTSSFDREVIMDIINRFERDRYN